MRAIVVGAGVFGVWTAWHLCQSGVAVILVDAWGPANSRSSSGDVSRIIRAVYGNRPQYVELTHRSFAEWEALERDCGRRILQRTGVLWFFGENEEYLTGCRAHLQRWNLTVEQLDLAAASERFPQVNWDGVRTAYFEPRAGWLFARRSVHAVCARFQAAGGTFLIGDATPRFAPSGRLDGVTLGDGSVLKGDRYIFACGPWLGKIFPEWIGPWLRPSRQEVFYFGPPAGDAKLTDAALPAWLDEARGNWYGIPGNENRGFKVSGNDPGETVDPTRLDRMPSPAQLERAREHLAFRFPAMAGAPLLEARVCQYENTPDRHLLLDQLPADPRVVAIGGGSGHGFKMGPAVGELAANVALGKAAPPVIFRVDRFNAAPERTGPTEPTEHTDKRK